MGYYKELYTGEDNYKDFWDDCITPWRFARVINSYALEGCTIADYAILKDSRIGKSVLLNKNSFILSSEIGDKSQIGFNTKVLYASIGKYCSISWDCSIGGPNHNIKSASTFNFTGGREHYEAKPCTIDNDVWIGAGVTIMRGIKIGTGAIIGGALSLHTMLLLMKL